MILANDLLLHEVWVTTSAERLTIPSVVCENAETMAVVLSFLEAAFAEKGLFVDGAIIADEDYIEQRLLED